MTQQQNARKTFPSLAREASIRPPLTHTKASGDSNEKHRNRSKSKNNKVPKSVRYDLENALVSLCDVWFEEIKPYLVRNNIKLHVHGAGAELAAGDRERAPVAARCSHLDPALSASDCDLCRLLFNAANSIESAVSQAACAPAAGNMSFNTENSEPKSRRSRRRRPASNSQPFAPTNDLPHTSHAKKGQNIRKKSHSLEKNSFVEPAIKPKMKNKLVQTEKPQLIEPNTCKPKSCLKSFRRCDATTTLFPAEKNNEQDKIPPLFPNDLIEIIAKKNDKRLQVLFKSPVLSQYSSIMNLLPSPEPIRKTSPQKKPWR